MADGDRPRTLLEELHASRTATEGLTNELKTLSERLDTQAENIATERRWRRALVGVSGCVFALTLFVVWFAITTRADLRNFGERLFVNSCEDNNTARATGNEGRTQQAEGLIKIFNADETRPDLANEYRQITQDINDAFPQRDCQSELDAAG